MSGNLARNWDRKFAIEWTVAMLGFIFILPLLAVLAALIKATSPGPVFYTSDRLGRYGRVIRLHKLRSMRVGAVPVLGQDGKVLTLENDPRLTPIGRFLRLGFDELPQLANVIRGDMCLIGPRPDVPWELERYSAQQRERLQVLPGITGLAAVAGGRFMSNADNYELDRIYVRESSLLMDLKILLLTLPYSLGLEGIGAWAFRDVVDRLTVRTPAATHTDV